MDTIRAVNEILDSWNNFQDDLLNIIKTVDYNNNKEIEEILTTENEHTLIKIIRMVQK